jgi:hypothetical protein
MSCLIALVIPTIIHFVIRIMNRQEKNNDYETTPFAP